MCLDPTPLVDDSDPDYLTIFEAVVRRAARLHEQMNEE